jgi:hypothetical protein
MTSKAYSVVVDGMNSLRVFDANTGTTVRSLKLQESIHSSPVVVNDRVTVIVQNSSGKRKGIIFKLPGLSQVFSFPVA